MDGQYLNDDFHKLKANVSHFSKEEWSRTEMTNVYRGIGAWHIQKKTCILATKFSLSEKCA